MTIIRSEGQNLFFAGQCQIALRDVNPFEENQVHTLTVSENIEVRIIKIYNLLFFLKIISLLKKIVASTRNTC